MAIDFAQNRDFFVLEGRVLTSGGSLQVTNGVLAVVDNSKGSITQNGRKVVSSFSNQPKDKDFQILLGALDKPVTRSTTNKPYESLPFKISEIESLKVVAPQDKGIKVDDFVLGYNGKVGTGIKLGDRTASSIDITLCGEPMYNLGYNNGEVTLTLQLAAPYLDENGAPIMDDAVTMQEIVENAVAEFNKITLLGGEPVTNYVDVIPVNSTNGTLTGTTSFTFFTVTIADAGDSLALARVQASNPSFKVVVTDRVNDEFTTYTLLAPTGTVLADVNLKGFSTVKECEDCPAGFTATDAGFVYNFTVEDNGTSLVANFDSLPNTTTVTRFGNEGGTGTYQVVASVELDITAFIAALFAIASNAVYNTTVGEFVGTVTELCSKAGSTVAWASSKTCSASSDIYRITVKDDECDGNKLTELQAAYPELAIAVDTPNLTRTVTLTGTSGTANVNIGGVNYLATFASTLTQTATNFVSTHAAAILAATGAVVTASTGTLVIVAPVDTYPSVSIANVTTNLAGTISAAVGSGAEVEGLCQTTYRTNVVTNVVCDECDEAFRALFVSEAPVNFGMNVWTKAAKTFDEDAEMGIRFRGKEFVLAGSETYRDDMPFYATSTKLKVAGGQPQYIAESWNSTTRPFALKVFSIASEPEALGGHLWEREDQARHYFDGFERLEGNNYGKWLWGQETKLKALSQYVDYQVTIFPKKYYQYTPHSSEMITYHIIVPVGQHTDVENLLNSLAAAAGLPTVKA